GLWPDGTPAPLGNVILLSAEDAADDTIRPRIDQLGGEPSRIWVLEAVHDGTTERPFNLNSDLTMLEKVTQAKGATAIVIDPLSAYLGRADSFKDAEVRGLLAPVAE